MKAEELKKKLKKMRHEYSVAKEIDKLFESKKTAIPITPSTAPIAPPINVFIKPNPPFLKN